jgi:hypothetical protein
MATERAAITKERERLRRQAAALADDLDARIRALKDV